MFVLPLIAKQLHHMLPIRLLTSLFHSLLPLSTLEFLFLPFFRPIFDLILPFSDATKKGTNVKRVPYSVGSALAHQISIKAFSSAKNYEIRHLHPLNKVLFHYIFLSWMRHSEFQESSVFACVCVYLVDGKLCALNQNQHEEQMTWVI